MDESCKTCRFFNASALGSSGCRRYPPKVVIPAPGSAVTVYPAVGPADWCGLYEREIDALKA